MKVRLPTSPVLYYFASALSLILIAGGLHAAGPRGSVRVRETSRVGNVVTFEVTVPAPAFDTDAAGALHVRRYTEQHPNGDPLASIAIPLRLSRTSRVAILSQESDILAVHNLQFSQALQADVASDGKRGAAVARMKSLSVPHNGIGYAALSYVGRSRAADISRLELGILDRVDANHIRYAKKIMVRVTDPDGLSSRAVTDLSEPFHVTNGVFKSRLAISTGGKGSKIQSAGDVEQLPGIQSDDGNVYRMNVRQSGIYHISFDDVRNFGIDPARLDPATMRIINKGQQVPVYIFDHQDGKLDSNDYFEFYGEEKRYDGPGTLGDFYYDPDTKDNTYYLVWGTRYSPIPVGGIKRIVEESGEIRFADNMQYTDLKDASFATKIHFEQNNVHDDLEVSDIDLRSDLRDHDFMSIVYAGKSYSTSTVVPFPDLRENGPVSFKVALHGISHFDPGATDAKGNELPNVDSENVVSVFVNGSDVLHGTWDSQTLKFIADSSSHLAQVLGVNSVDPSGGIPPVTITFANRRDQYPGFQPGCRFAVNWIEIGYDRKYYAYQDQLTFHAPHGSAPGLYQFTLQNFEQTDISIYRKSVSKISNVALVSNPDQVRSSRAIFQIHVASDADEFFAVSESAKLKPYRYTVDDFANLRAPTNAGEYLIITNRDHLSKGNGGGTVPLQGLLDYRTSTNHITGKLVDVANIYDEFNYGARSPNAIKAFLKYAYNNWQDPPKYVLLAGVTHIGNGDPLQFAPPDQVPTPYIQAYLEGDVAGDAWYSMVDGDDLVPDLILGRLATSDIRGDAAYFSKLKEYEADKASPGDWKNKALFIGAGGSFDSDIDGLLQRDLPPRVNVLRQSTVTASPYTLGNGQALFDVVNAGLGCVAYFGHGGNAIWADPLESTGQVVLDNTKISRFHNAGHYPLVLSMTCFTAGFDAATPEPGILNSFITAPSAGAIACFGTTSFGWEQNDERIAEAIVPHLYDSVGGTIAERILAGKTEYLLRTNPGDLIPPTLMYGYHFLGDPLLATHPPTDHVYLTPASRTIQPGGSVQLTGTTSIVTGSASIELADNKLSPFGPPHIVSNIPVANGQFSVTDKIPNTASPFGTFRVIVSDNSDSRYAASSEDVTITNARVTELDFEPRPLPVGSNLDLSAAVQTPQSIVSVIDTLRIYSQNGGGVVTQAIVTSTMLPGAGSRYHATIPASQLKAGDRVAGKVTLVTSGGTVSSDSLLIIVGAAADPAAFKDMNHRNLTGKYVSTKSGLAWQERVYNWGASPLGSSTVSLIDMRPASPKVLGSAGVFNVSSHHDTIVTIPVTVSSLDSASIVFAVSPDAGTGPLNLRDSLLANDSTLPLGYPPAAAAYLSTTGTTMDGTTFAQASFDGGEVTLQLPTGAEGNVAADVIRFNRVYVPIQSPQPDIHFLPLISHTRKAYTSMQIVSDSLGAIPLQQSPQATLSLRVDTSIKVTNKIYIYRRDDRTKLWTQLATTRNAGIVTANITNLGTFAIAYHTDTRPPVVDITVEGQVFTNKGEVPSVPHLHAVIQDENGIDITPGKTIVKIDNRTLAPSEYVMLDSGRTSTTVNLRMEPSLSDGTHAITIQATDDNGLTNTPPKELDVHVSKDFSIGLLGSYPNPFTRDMFIAYEIRGIAYAISVSLDIYTVSGRRITTMTTDGVVGSPGFFRGGTGTPTSLGYHEVWWNGLDDNGAEVANGVYFYRFAVNTGDATREIKGKFARVR